MYNIALRFLLTFFFLLSLPECIVAVLPQCSRDDYDAGAPKMSPEFQVNKNTLNNQQNGRSAALPNNKGFVVVWQSYGQDGSGFSIYAQRFLNSGTKIGEEFQVNTRALGDQSHLDIAALYASDDVDSDGEGFVVTWMSDGQDGSNFGIYAQRFSNEGTRIGVEFPVNAYTTEIQRYPRVAALRGGGGDGRFVIVWDSLGQDGSDYGIFAQVFTANGIKTGKNEFQVSEHTLKDQAYACVVDLPKYRAFVVTWQSNGKIGGMLNDIYARRFAYNGESVGPEERVNEYTSSNQEIPSIAALSNSEIYVITWDSKSQDGHFKGIYAQRYNGGNGTKLGSEFPVNNCTTNNQMAPSVAALPYTDAKAEGQAGEGFIIGWDSEGQDGSYYGVFAQRFSSDGTKKGMEFRLNNYTTNHQSRAFLTTLSNSEGVIATWHSQYQDGSEWGLFGRILSKANKAPLITKVTPSRSKSFNKSATVTASRDTASLNLSESVSKRSSSSSLTPLAAAEASPSLTRDSITASNHSVTHSAVPGSEKLPKEAHDTIQGSVLGDAIGKDAGKAIVGISYSAGAFGAVTGTPAAGGVGSRVSSSMRGVLCMFVDSIMEPTWADGIVAKLGDDELAQVSGTAMCTSIVVAIMYGLNLVMRKVYERRDARWVKILLEVICAANALLLQAYFSSLSYMSTLLLFRGGTSVAPICIGIFGHAVLIGVLCIKVWILAFRFGAQRCRRTNAGDARMGRVGRMMLKNEFEDAPNSKGFVAAFGFMFDGCRDETRLLHRLYFVVDLLFSYVMGVLSGLPILIGDCVAVGCLIIVLCIVYLLYLVIIRPYAKMVDTLMVSIFGVIQLVAALMGLLANYFTLCYGILSYLMLVLAFSMLVQVGLGLAWLWFLSERRKFRQEVGGPPPSTVNTAASSGLLDVPMVSVSSVPSGQKGSTQSHTQAPSSSSSANPNTGTSHISGGNSTSRTAAGTGSGDRQKNPLLDL